MQAAGISPLPLESPSLEIRNGPEGKQTQNQHRDIKINVKNLSSRGLHCSRGKATYIEVTIIQERPLSVEREHFLA